LFSLDEMIQLFDLDGVNHAPSSFSTEKLRWLNQQHLKDSDPARIAHLLSSHLGDLDIDPAGGPDLVEVIKAQRERASTLVELAEISRFYYQDFEAIDAKAAKKAFKAGADEALDAVRTKLAALGVWQREAIQEAIQAAVDELGVGFGKVAMPLRVAVTGGAPSPDLDLTLFLVGRDATVRRIDKAIERIGAAG
jgi:glutamyl-tRNA synthetase